MAGSLNRVTLIGNLGKDPEIRSTQDGKQIATFSVACGESWVDKSTGERKERTEWINCVVYSNHLVTIIKDYAKKGSKLLVEGSFQTRKWKDKEGIERYSTEVVLNGFNAKILLLDGKAESAPDNHNQAKQNAYVPDELDDSIPY